MNRILLNLPLELQNRVTSFIGPTPSAVLISQIPIRRPWDSTLFTILRRKRAVRKASKRYRHYYCYV